MPYTLLQGHPMLSDATPLLLLLSSRALRLPQYISPLFDVIYDVFFVTYPKVSQSCLWRGCSITLVYLDVKVSRKMLRAESDSVSEGNSPVCQDESGSSKPGTSSSIEKHASKKWAITSIE